MAFRQETNRLHPFIFKTLITKHVKSNQIFFQFLLFYTMLYYIILFYTILYYTILYYDILCYTILYHAIYIYIYVIYIIYILYIYIAFSQICVKNLRNLKKQEANRKPVLLLGTQTYEEQHFLPNDTEKYQMLIDANPTENLLYVLCG